MNGLVGLLNTKKGNYVLIYAALVWMQEVYLPSQGDHVTLYCMTGLFAVALLCQTALDMVDRFKGRITPPNE